MSDLTDKTGAAVTVRRDDHRGAYVIEVGAEGTDAGRTFFLDRDHEEVAERVFFHTEFGGRGLATILVREAIAATREAGKLIVPVCPLVRGVLTKNAEEYEGTFRQNRPADFAWVQEELAARKQG